MLDHKDYKEVRPILPQVNPMEIALTKISAKGQVVIPKEMRKNLKQGEQLLLIKDKEHIVMKKASALDKQLSEDIAFARKTEEAWKQVDEGKITTMEFDAFIEEIKKW